MTYNVFSGTLNPTQSVIHQTGSKITKQTSTVILKKQRKLNYART